MKHCKTCICDGKPVMSDERIRTLKLYGAAPREGCLDYRRGHVCGARVFQNDRCKEHQKKGTG